MNNYFKLIILIFALNQNFKTEGKSIVPNSMEIVPSLMEYKEISDLRKQKTISEEKRACLDICSECFDDVIFFHLEK